ncbi:haloacid dehalogenase-like hydrolase (HAD) superfamily protein [Artemisia annua]|uniref:Haloacid dehalogenase-like hydrolase (HAD) superfamily protein n=1 Tax=Artemisia annua TaxID=35608 RepID=A0A2U1MIW2_ARTAN|nr:haloacid dehalogenase-like hydrolase (HAD) superfamily protein [Artemisia annua]
MVSKITKKPKPSPAKTRNLRRHKKTPISKTASVVVASINKSIYTCHRRLVKIFSKLVRIATPKNKSSKKKGYKVLRKYDNDNNVVSVRRSLFQENSIPLPPLKAPDLKTVVLDLDETLVHSVLANGLPPPGGYDFVVRPLLDGERVTFYVVKRPFVDEFLEFLSVNGFEIVVFTAGIEEYAALVLEKLDKKGVISHKLYRASCKECDGRFVKDLSGLGRDLKRAVIVDDNPNSYSLQPENAIPIRPFVDDFGDVELKKLMDGFFKRCDEFDDLKDAVKSYVSESVKLIDEGVLGDSKDSNYQALIEV